MLIPTRLLIATESFGKGLPARLVAEAIGRGLEAEELWSQTCARSS